MFKCGFIVYVQASLGSMRHTNTAHYYVFVFFFLKKVKIVSLPGNIKEKEHTRFPDRNTGPNTLLGTKRQQHTQLKR